MVRFLGKRFPPTLMSSSPHSRAGVKSNGPNADLVLRFFAFFALNAHIQGQTANSKDSSQCASRTVLPQIILYIPQLEPLLCGYPILLNSDLQSRYSLQPWK